jgi:histidinol phosphatase-like enzyme
MLRRAADRYGLDLNRSYLIGDSWRDSGAARRAGCTSVQLRRATHARAQPGESPDFWAQDFAEASQLILAMTRRCPGT